MLQDAIYTEAHHGAPQGILPAAVIHDSFEENGWRRSPDAACPIAARSQVLASRWVDRRASFRREYAASPSDRYIVSLCLRQTRMRLMHDECVVLDGLVPVGTLHVAGPAQSQVAEFDAPCDFLHLYVDADYLRTHQSVGAAPRESDLNGFVGRDPIAAELGRTLTQGRSGQNRPFASSVGQAIVMRLLALQPPRQGPAPLQKWRLRRVQEYVLDNIGEPIRLHDLAKVAGLSRMHFAAQFRAATGCSPHDYVTQQRIDCAKAMLSRSAEPLVQIGLSVGFQNQSHFTTVFKRVTGDSPAKWQRINRVLG